MIHVVQQGDCLSSIAARYGVKGWRDLYEHPDNEELRKKRPNPNVLLPGDEVVVDEPRRRWETRPTEKRHSFVLPIERVKLRIVLRHRAGQPYAGKRFVVSVGARDVEGTTSSDGLVEAWVPATAAHARLRVWLSDRRSPEIDRDLLVGHIDPVDVLSGVQGRLRNLGYRCPVGPLTGSVDDPTLSAVRAFRAKHDLPEVAPPGDDPDADPDEVVDRYARALMDDALRDKLRDCHDTSAP
jgi:N-acetylmuramoyl-L-alanine amidase